MCWAVRYAELSREKHKNKHKNTKSNNNEIHYERPEAYKMNKRNKKLSISWVGSIWSRQRFRSSAAKCELRPSWMWPCIGLVGNVRCHRCVKWKKREENCPSISQCVIAIRMMMMMMVGVGEETDHACFKCFGKATTYFEAVKMRLSTQVMSFIDASVFISASASHVLTFHKRISPPRHADKRISEYIAIPATQPLCALFIDCLSSPLRKSQRLIPESREPEKSSASTPTDPRATTRAWTPS